MTGSVILSSVPGAHNTPHDILKLTSSLLCTVYPKNTAIATERLNRCPRTHSPCVTTSPLNKAMLLDISLGTLQTYCPSHPHDEGQPKVRPSERSMHSSKML